MQEERIQSCDSGEGDDICLCPLEGVIETISRKWTLQIVAAIGNNGKLRYTEIQTILRSISPKSLSDRLKELVQEGLIGREVFAEIPPRVEYSLTEDGEELRRLIKPLMSWVSKRKSVRT